MQEMKKLKPGEPSPSNPFLEYRSNRKAEPWEEVVRILRKILERLLCCVTCGCYPGPKDSLAMEVYDAELMEEERDAIQNLLQYLDSEDHKDWHISDEHLRALCILTYSDNIELHRSAALCFAELSERMRSSVSEVVLEPLVVLLRSRDPEVQKAASLAISNFALNGPESNRDAIMNSGAMPALVELLFSKNVEVQCNTCGCITTLATTDKNKQTVVTSGGIRPLLSLAKSTDVRVQRNATGAILNLTHLQSNRNELVQRGALPILVEVLHSGDPDVQYYCTAALSNLAINEKHRAMIVALGRFDAVRRLTHLLGSSHEKVQCQTCLALRNLASDGDNQILIVRMGGLPKLHHILQKGKRESTVAALACLRNLSIHRANEAGIIAETFLKELRRIVKDSSNPDAQSHAAGTIRNLAAGDQIQAIIRSGCVESLLHVLLSGETVQSVMCEATAALAVLADQDAGKAKILSDESGRTFRRLISLAALSDHADIQYNCAGTLGQLALSGISEAVIADNLVGLLIYLERFLRHPDPTFTHIALWTMLQLFKSGEFQHGVCGHDIREAVKEILASDHTDAVKELATTVLHRLQPTQPTVDLL